MLEEIGMNTSPSYHAKRTDLIQSVSFQTAQQMIAFVVKYKRIHQSMPIMLRNQHICGL